MFSLTKKQISSFESFYFYNKEDLPKLILHKEQQSYVKCSDLIFFNEKIETWETENTRTITTTKKHLIIF